MEWNSEHTQLQLTCVTGAAQSRLNYLVAVISPQKLYEQLQHCPLSCFYILAWYHCWLIIRCSVIAVLQSRTLERKTRVQLRKTNVFDGRNECSILSLFASVFVCAARSSATPRSHNLSIQQPSLTVVSVAPMHGTVACLRGPQVLTLTSYQTRKNAGNTGLAHTASTVR